MAKSTKVIKTKGLTCKVHMITEKIYAVEVPDDYERALLFMRYQEYYESPVESIRRKKLDFALFMLEYAKKMKKRGQGFSYLTDWYGYNIPSHSLVKCLKNVHREPEKLGANFYDHKMREIVEWITRGGYPFSLEPGFTKRFYIIGVDSIGDSSTMDHEMAHGLFYTVPRYKKEMTELVTSLPVSATKKMNKALKALGYHDSVLVDEAQAYLATGLYTTMKGLEKHMPKFQEVFKRYRKDA